MRNTYFFIDGKYLSIISKHFGNGKYLKLDLNKLAVSLAKRHDLWCVRTYYYTAPPFQSSPPSEFEIKMKSGYDKYVNNLKKMPHFNVREGRCQKVDGDFHQKGVDTLFTMDLCEIKNDLDIDTIILIACDTDFVPILEKLSNNGCDVILYYYSDFVRGSKFSMSNHLQTVCTESNLITKDDLMSCQYIKKE